MFGGPSEGSFVDVDHPAASPCEQSCTSSDSIHPNVFRTFVPNLGKRESIL